MSFRAFLPLAALLALAPVPALAWGGTGHAAIDRAAIEALPADGPAFLKDQADFIVASASLPDAWRNPAEPFAKMAEDPNHGWFREQFAFLRPIPRSRHAFVIALHDRYLVLRKSDPATAARTNVRWTGTLPYAAMEAWERLIVAMRAVRKAQAEGRDPRWAQLQAAYEVIRLGHYIGDGAQPLHVSIHSDGWRGPDPKGYTRDPAIHGLFESHFVDGMGLTAQQVGQAMRPPAHQSGDMFNAVLAYLDQSGEHLEELYTLEKRSHFNDFSDADVRALVVGQTAQGASMLRDMLLRAWAESAKAQSPVSPSPLDPANPAYDPATGSAPAQLRP